MTISYINVLQHSYWDMYVVKRAWEQIDERVDRLLAIDELENLFVMSDHGANEIEDTFRVNTWLEKQGYLETESVLVTIFIRSESLRSEFVPFWQKWGVEWLARRFLPQRVQMLLPDKEGSVDRSGKADVIDWNSSKAVASSQGPVYVLADDPKEREHITNSLIDDLKA